MTEHSRSMFPPPGDRPAPASDGAGIPLDRIFLSDHVVETEIGAFQSERGTAQRVRFNIAVEVRPPGRGPADDVDRVMSYDAIAEAVRAELSEGRVNLLETLAERIAERILADERAERVFARIEKLDRLPGALGVEIVRSRGSAAPAARGHPRPLVVYLGNEVVDGRGLADWLDALERRGAPVALCVGPADSPAPESGAPLAQRRIDLLAIEQNAWRLAGRDSRCLVVDSRAEIDSAMRSNRMIVWAPSKIALDAHDAPKAGHREPVALAAWLAGHLDAARLLVVGTRIPAGVAVSVPLELREAAEIG